KKNFREPGLPSFDLCINAVERRPKPNRKRGQKRKKNMRLLLTLVFLTALLAGCNNSGRTPGQELDTLLKKADTTVDRLADSSASKFRQLKDKVDGIHIRKDSTKRNDTATR
ncbi:MAG: hypothetical protein JWP27_2455, partial [Flaviaesturariibacter sp.]|nr:hypothetical protein [Flaviaesturariibacter sp.]